MRRRKFLGVLGGAFTAWPLTGLAQVSPKRPLVAWLGASNKVTSEGLITPFLRGMRELGYVENTNFDIVYRLSDGFQERLPALVEELVRLKPNVILGSSTISAVAARGATSTIPIVSAALADAVHLGLIASEARPGGNVTGISPYVAGLPAKQMEFAREIVPGASRIGLLTDANDPKAPPQLQELVAAAESLKLKATVAPVRLPSDLEGAMQSFVDARVDVIIVLQTSMLISERKQIAALAAQKRLPAIYGYREHVIDGGLVSYGVDLRWCFHRAATYVHKILNGATPADLPVEFPTNLLLSINLKSAKALGLDLPLFLQQRADEVIE